MRVNVADETKAIWWVLSCLGVIEETSLQACYLSYEACLHYRREYALVRVHKFQEKSHLKYQKYLKWTKSIMVKKSWEIQLTQGTSHWTNLIPDGEIMSLLTFFPCPALLPHLWWALPHKSPLKNPFSEVFLESHPRNTHLEMWWPGLSLKCYWAPHELLDFKSQVFKGREMLTEKLSWPLSISVKFIVVSCIAQLDCIYPTP